LARIHTAQQIPSRGKFTQVQVRNEAHCELVAKGILQLRIDRPLSGTGLAYADEDEYPTVYKTQLNGSQSNVHMLLRV